MKPRGLFLIGGGLMMLAFAAIIIPKVPTAADPPPSSTTTAPPATTPTVPSDRACGPTPIFFAKQATGNRFGSAVEGDLPAVLTNLDIRLSCDPSLTIGLNEYVCEGFSSPEERVSKTVAAIQNPDQWDLAGLAVSNAVHQGNPRIVSVSGPYQTLYAVTEGREIPELFATHPDRPAFMVLQFDTPCGVKMLKLDCGFQPVEKDFGPNIPTKTQPPSKNQPQKPPAIPPMKPGTPAYQPPETVPPSHTTVPSSPTTTWKCDKAHNAGSQYCDPTGGDPGTPPHQPQAPVPTTPGYVPGASQNSPGVVIPPGGNMSPGSNGPGQGTGGFGPTTPTTELPQPVAPPGDPCTGNSTSPACN